MPRFAVIFCICSFFGFPAAQAEGAAASCAAPLLPDGAAAQGYFHTFSVDDALAMVKAGRRLSLREVRGSSEADRFFCVPKLLCFAEEARREKRNRLLLTLRDTLGRRFALKASFVKDEPGNYTFRPRDLAALAPETFDLTDARPRLHEIYVVRAYWAMGDRELSDHLFYGQLAHSATVLADPGNRERIEGVREATDLTVRFLRRRGRLRLPDLAAWHRALSRGAPDAAEALPGTLRAREAWQTGHGEVLYRFLPPAEVRAASENLLRRVWALRPGSDPEQAFALYQEFLRIHPFERHNGRLAARQLLNYMLLRMELPPVMKLTPSLFHAPGELYARYFEKWRKKSL